MLENDHALDLLSGETSRWVQSLRDVLALPDPGWDDVEGPLLYVHLLAVCRVQVALESVDGRPIEPGRSSHDIVAGWQAGYLRAFDKALAQRAGEPDYLRDRRAVIVDLFASLLAHSPTDDARVVKPVAKRKRR